MKLTDEQLNQLQKEIKEANESPYFNTFSGAVQAARASAEAKGYEINENDWFNQINVGQGKPKEGQTTNAVIGLLLNGKPQRKHLNIQVYNMGLSFGGGKNYELNYYIN